jgi:hypothetical protein
MSEEARRVTPRNTSFAIGIGSMAASPHADWGAMDIRDKPTAAPASPWQNGFSERLIGSIRRERTRRSLDKDAPVSRPVQRI